MDTTEDDIDDEEELNEFIKDFLILDSLIEEMEEEDEMEARLLGWRFSATMSIGTEIVLWVFWRFHGDDAEFLQSALYFAEL